MSFPIPDRTRLRGLYSKWWCLAGLWLVGCAHRTLTVESVGSVDAPVEVEYERAYFALRADGSRDYTYTVSYLVHRSADLGPWGMVEVLWGPWFQSQPKVEVEIVRPDGSSIPVDPETFERGPIDAHGGDSRMRMVGRLPPMPPGSLVTQRIFYGGVKPTASDISDGRFYFGARAPVHRSELVVDAPANVEVRTVVRGRGVLSSQRAEDGRKIRTFSMKELPPRRGMVPNLPTHVPRLPYVSFSTASDWPLVAKVLASRFARRLRDAELDELVAGISSDKAATEVISEVIARVNEQVEFTGRRFGSGPVIPLHPEETLARGEGDGEDIALLVVAALRSLGLRADVALMRSAPEEDVRPELPGVTVFDRAVVRVMADGPIWIDPLEAHYPVGYLPPDLEGRWALVVHPETGALVRTPTLGLAHNQYKSRRRLMLPDYGRLRVTETSQAYGAIGASRREQLSADPNSDGFASAYTSSQLGSSQVSHLRRTVPRDLSQPVQLEVSVKNSRLGITDLHTAFVDLRATSLFGWLPLVVREAVTFPSDDPTKNTALNKLYERKQPFVLNTPYEAELIYEVVPPAGFQLVETPEDRSYSWGPARLTVKFAEKKEYLQCIFRFTTGKSIYRPEDLVKLAVGLRELSQESATRVRFFHTYSRELVNGDLSVALNGFVKLAEQHPASAEHKARLALALIDVGFGDAAREIAREASRQSSVLAHYVLGRVLSHDWVGRLHAPGFDREGAIRALEYVKRTDPHHIRARAELAALYAIDDIGLRHQDEAYLESALMEYQSLREDTGINAFDELMADTLLHAGRWDEALSVAKSAPHSVRRGAILLAAQVVLDKGVDAALLAVESLKVDPQEYSATVKGAVSVLAGTEHYALAADLLAAMATGDAASVEQPKVTSLRRLQRFEDILRPEGDPARVVQLAIARLLEGRLSPTNDLEIFPDTWSEDEREQEFSMIERMFSLVRRSAYQARMVPSLLRDDILSRLRYEIDHSSFGVVRVRAILDETTSTVWFLRGYGEQGYRMIGTGRSLRSLGDRVLTALSQGDTQAADQWLKWAGELWNARSSVASADRIDFLETPFVRLVRRYPNERRLAAKVLRVAAPAGASNVADLEDLQMVRTSAAPQDLRDTIVHAELLGWVRLGNWKRVLQLLDQLAPDYPNEAVLHHLRISGQFALERWDRAEQLIRGWLAAHPDDLAAVTKLASLHTARGHFAEAEKLLQELAKQNPSSSMVYNNLAWVSLFRGAVDQSDLDWALKANALNKGKNPAEIHTLAALYAEAGDAQETIKWLRRRLDLLRVDRPQSMDYYLLGRLMERMGLVQLAQQAYLKVEKSEGNRKDSTYALAQRRLRRLRG